MKEVSVPVWLYINRLLSWAMKVKWRDGVQLKFSRWFR